MIIDIKCCIALKVLPSMPGAASSGGPVFLPVKEQVCIGYKPAPSVIDENKLNEGCSPLSLWILRASLSLNTVFHVNLAWGVLWPPKWVLSFLDPSSFISSLIRSQRCSWVSFKTGRWQWPTRCWNVHLSCLSEPRWLNKVRSWQFPGTGSLAHFPEGFQGWVFSHGTFKVLLYDPERWFSSYEN